MIFVGGMALAITGLAASSPPDEPPAPAPVRPPVPVSVMATAPTSTVEVLPYPAPLPELAVDEPTLRTGKQIRSAVATGHCEHAWVMWRGLRTTQPTYAAALVDGPVLSPCRRN